ncbi:hypothetical protein Moror_5635 [Moniliophthora roreri MCA 2997]|uniref:Uncharacterized protein n=1 Tax=Moniliophthora roreri (strain MCA 2997) TaxID=1381753 RepID=V2WMI2_MONRO|nr:hypothetical protein Moror_5635 [Moniliophthora roreri MCA 2997]
MAEEPSTFGDTLSSGIQDVAALLPLLGTDQCERHVGSALEKGYLYAAAASLSLFGSLGTVKVGFATLLATVTYPFYGGRWLGDAGFGTPGSVSSLVTVDNDTGMYGAELKLQKLLKEQHIDDPTLVKGFEWSGWRKVHTERGHAGGKISVTTEAGERYGPDSNSSERWIDTVRRCLNPRNFSWNVQLICSSLVCAILSIAPYLYLMHAIQLALQLRIHCVNNTALAWLKIQRKYRTKDDVNTNGQRTILENRIRNYVHLPERSLFFRERVSDEEMQPDLPLSLEERAELSTLLAPNWYLAFYQLVIAIGMVMIVAGYVGCFSLVGQTGLKGAPYVWFGLEAALSLLRIFLWGSNPDWDEDGTGLTMSLQLRPLHSSGSNGESEMFFPLVTSPYEGHHLGINPEWRGERTIYPPPALIVQSESDFLGAATTFIGPLQRLDSNDVTLLYSVLAKKDEKSLYTTVLFTSSRPPLTFPSSGSEVYSSTLGTIPNTGALQVTIGDPILKSSDSFLDSQLYHEVVNHSKILSARLFKGEQHHSLDVTWNLVSLRMKDVSERNLLTSKQLSSYDKAYRDLRKSWSAKSEYSDARGNILEELGARDAEYREKHIFYRVASLYGEVLFLVESIILELQLWHEECLLADTGDPIISRQMLPECMRAMQSRIGVEKQHAIKRYSGYKWKDSAGEEVLLHEWDFMLQKLLQLRESEHLQGEAKKLLSIISHLSPVANLVTSAMELAHQLNEYTSLAEWLSTIAEIPSDDTDPAIMSPQQKLEIMFHLMLHRLQRIASGSFTIARSLDDSDSWWSSIHIPDFASWGLYIHSFTPDILCRATQCVAAELMSNAVVHKTAETENIEEETHGEQVKREGDEKRGDSGKRRECFLLPASASQQLTTIIIHTSVITDDTRAAATELVTSNSNVLCLSGLECNLPGECDQPHCNAISANRQTWKEENGVM